MPRNGEINTSFGVYKNQCCGREIIIREGATFPGCQGHPKSVTNWDVIEVEVIEVITINRKAQADPAA